MPGHPEWQSLGSKAKQMARICVSGGMTPWQSPWTREQLAAKTPALDDKAREEVLGELLGAGVVEEVKGKLVLSKDGISWAYAEQAAAAEAAKNPRLNPFGPTDDDFGHHVETDSETPWAVGKYFDMKVFEDGSNLAAGLKIMASVLDDPHHYGDGKSDLWPGMRGKHLKHFAVLWHPNCDDTGKVVFTYFGSHNSPPYEPARAIDCRQAL